ncbi:hypothetical protein G6M89_04255 [Natronolimnobius sp. AArcel1]|uniref:hypothetical protein n=1 Tax=Natronolimnobius sp. AArcel1 TaxID=1679093 RepID=UPI0013EC7894|nr:hypothetical protein [Natronolimnobius sp. AArcel1]NGM68228.1 hypothetical protein [Natronolimnobius sp. AArcel1]
MATMTPASLLALFCAIMSLLAAGRLVLTQRRDHVDVGTLLVVIGITFMSVLWLAIVRSWSGVAGWFALASIGVGLIAIGLGQIVRYWNEPRYDSRHRPDDNGL